VLTLSVLPSMASAFLVPRLGGFLAQHPQLEIDLQFGVGLVDFARDVGVDAALRSGADHWQGRSTNTCSTKTLAPVASPALIERLGMPTLQELHRWPLLGDPGGHWARWFTHFRTPRPTLFLAANKNGVHPCTPSGNSVGVAGVRHQSSGARSPL